MTTIARPTLSADDARAIIDPAVYGQWEPLKAIFARLRADSPVAWAEVDGYRPFWAVTRHADIMAVSKDNRTFLNAPDGVIMGPIGAEQLIESVSGGSPHLVRSLVTLDGPEHMAYRKLTQNWFMPANLKRIEDDIRAIARATVDKMLATGGTCDFARDVASEYPLHVIMRLLGVPAEDEALMLQLTQQMFGGEDPELNPARSLNLPPDVIAQFVVGVVKNFEDYFGKLAIERRRNPRDDVATIIANGTIDGAPIDDRMAAGYYIIVAAAGHDTTSASTSGAMWALAEDPEEYARVRADPALLSGLIEEAIRWTTPVQHFLRHIAEDTEVGGVPMKAGERLMLCYISGNYDEAVFAEPDRFRAGRSPNRHCSFGAGAHQCLGLHLARLEMRILFEELLPRVKSVELAGEPSRAMSTFVGGPKRLPIRFEAA